MEQKPEIEDPKKCNWCNQNMDLHYFGQDGLMCPISSDHVASSVNVTGTDQKIANWLTHPVFPVRSDYYRAALMPVIRKIIVDGSRADVTTKQKRSG